MIRDHYLVLGVSRIENESAIQGAFRSLAKRYHPDQAGVEATPRFREVLQAYEVLSDPDRRRSYDAALERADSPAPEWPAKPLYRQTETQSEPLIPRTLSIASDFDVVEPRRDDLAPHMGRTFMLGGSNGEYARSLSVVVVVPTDTAVQGGLISVRVPVFAACPTCRGTGRDWLSHCLKCGGSGASRSEHTVRVRVPPLMGNRVVDVPLFGFGIGNVLLRLHLQVAR